MIIQIELDDKGTKYIDGVSDIVVENGFKNPQEILTKYAPLEYHILTGGDDNWNYRYISYKDKNSNHRSIITKNQFFVMNENGKTIGNYKPIEI